MKKLVAPVLTFALSFQALGQTLAEDRREEERRKVIEDLKQSLCMVTFPMSRGCVDMATHGRGGYMDLSGLGWLMLPGAFILDTFMLAASPIVIPGAAIRTAYIEAKNKINSMDDQDKLHKETNLLRDHLVNSLNDTANLIGRRFIKSEDILALTLGYTAIRTYTFRDRDNSYDVVYLPNNEKLTKDDIDVFPNEAQNAFRALVSASNNIRYLKSDQQKHDGFMKALLERMTVVNESDFQTANVRKKDALDDVIAQLRSAAHNIDQLRKALKVMN